MALPKVRRNMSLLLGQLSPMETKRWADVTTEEFASMLKRQFGPELVRMIREGESQQREVGAMLCQSSDGSLRLNQECWGSRRSVTVHNCKRRLQSVSSFHVHLSGADTFSTTDLAAAVDVEQFSSLGYMKRGIPMLKVISTYTYRALPIFQRAAVRRGLAEADYDISRAVRLTNASEALALTNRALSTLQNIEKVFNAYEVEL